ncbi:MAG: hypothetical protein KJ623_01650 [Nanoarchaeota archaeon]|nr:hypothetical protein [Nanoarchaeota archaeon]MBU0962767.1 hypothetical protein [Nanoarchaeota archaeon]
MVWQDIVIALANVVLSAALLPQVIHGFKKKRGLLTLTTSIPTFIALFVISITYYTLSLKYAFVLALISSILWLILFIQSIIYKRA